MLGYDPPSTGSSKELRLRAAKSNSTIEGLSPVMIRARLDLVKEIKEGNEKSDHQNQIQNQSQSQNEGKNQDKVDKPPPTIARCRPVIDWKIIVIICLFILLVTMTILWMKHFSRMRRLEQKLQSAHQELQAQQAKSEQQQKHHEATTARIQKEAEESKRIIRAKIGGTYECIDDIDPLDVTFLEIQLIPESNNQLEGMYIESKEKKRAFSGILNPDNTFTCVFPRVTLNGRWDGDARISLSDPQAADKWIVFHRTTSFRHDE